MQEAHIRELLEQSYGLRNSKPAEGRILAREAVVLAERLNPGAAANDLRALSWAELGNASRVCNDLRAAERAFTIAWERQGRGSGVWTVAVRLYELHAALLKEQRAFPAADAALSAAWRLYAGDPESQARCLAQRASVAGYSGNPEAALQFLHEALGLIRGRRSDLRHVLLHNTAWFLVDIGRADMARDITLEMAQVRYAPEPLTEVRSRWLGARILAGLGEVGEAEFEMLSVLDEFQARGLWFDAALAALELAALQPSLRALDSLRRAQELFEMLGVQREADAAFLLREAIARRSVVAELAPKIALALRHLPLGARKEGRA